MTQKPGMFRLAGKVKKYRPTIYCFSNVVGGGRGMAYAMAEDGIVLGSHLCRNESCIPHDLGVKRKSRPGRHKIYKNHYPNGYKMEFVRAHKVKEHEGLLRAFKLNQTQVKEKDEEN